MTEFPPWVLPSLLTAFASVLLWLGRSVMAKLDGLEALVKSELRAMDVRIAVIESHLHINRS